MKQKYIQKTLIDDEQILLEAKTHKIVYLGVCLFSIMTVLIFLPLIAIAAASREYGASYTMMFLMTFILLFCLIYFLYLRAFYNRHEMIVTNKRVVCKSGVFGIHTEELQWGKIESIEMRQSVLGSIFGYGEIYFSGTGTSFVHFDKVKDPLGVKTEAAKILDDVRK